MEAKEVVAGTTLEILAPYLPYGIEINGPFMASEYPGETRKLTGLSADERGGVAETNNAAGFKEFSFVEHFLPVLYSFADLCTPLPDGTVPAEEAMKIVLGCKQPDGRTIDYPAYAATTRLHIVQVSYFLVNTSHNNVAAGVLIIDDAWDIGLPDAVHDLRYGNLLGAYDYLRSKHFACPINGKPLMEDVDYIRKKR